MFFKPIGSITEAIPRVINFIVVSLLWLTQRFSLALFIASTGVFLCAAMSAFAGEYEGDKNDDGLFHGRGSYVSDAGWEYSGQWLRGKKHGDGTQLWPNGDKYAGEWLDGMPNGKGSMTFNNGEQYVGEFVSGRMSGEGVFTYLQNARYAGEWLDDVPHGNGVMTFANGDEYRGGLVQGERSGSGLMKYHAGDVFNGQWQADKPSGSGLMTYANGDQYDGNWSNGRKHGQGVYLYANGNEYDGEWRNERQHGSGKMTYRDGSRYEGAWRKGFKQGQGKFVYAHGGFYMGEWHRGVQHGKGTLVEANGRAFVGAFERNARQGVGLCGVVSGVVSGNVSSAKTVVLNSQQACEYKDDVLVVAQLTAAKTNKPVTVTNSRRLAPAALIPTTVINKASLPSMGFVGSAGNNLQNKTRVEYFYFENDFPQGGIYEQPKVSWWKKTSSLMRNSLDIVTNDNLLHVAITIPKYKGPGTYSLGNKAASVKISGEEGKYHTSTKTPGSLTISRDDGGLLVGKFSFAVSNEQGRSFMLKNGDFRIKGRRTR